jgi:peroxiredoxin Q/BCP
MRKFILSLATWSLLAGVSLAQTTPSAPAQQQATPAAPKTHLKVGDAAPDFTLTDTTGKPVKLSEYKGKKNVVLAFYVLAFTGG